MTLLQHALRSSGLAFCSLCALTSPPAVAADDAATEKAILILDASGSMWGQVDGTHKITIAREVIGGLLDEWNPKVELGVSAYGHREKGNCADIETLVPVGPVDRQHLMSAVEGLNPKGKTPLTDAVREAAEALRYGEERATVILVSDGKETCDADPCAVAAELEAAGVDFTAHVVGFDVTEEEKAQLQCIADNTGGKFLSAKNSAELHEAMATTVKLVAEPEKRVVRVQVAALGELSIVNIEEKVLVRDAEGKLVSWVEQQPLKLKPGSYILAMQKQELTGFEIGAGEALTIDGNELVGQLSIQGIDEKVLVRDADDRLVTWVEHQPLELSAGFYTLATQKQELTGFEISAGEALTIDGNELVGQLNIEGMSEKVLVRDTEGKLVTWVERLPLELKAGSYRLGTLRQELVDFDIRPGEELIIELTN